MNPAGCETFDCLPVGRVAHDQLGLQKTTLTSGQPTKNDVKTKAYYFRLWVENRGEQRAEKVHVYAESLARRQADGSFKAVEYFLPMNLCWTHGLLPDSRPEIYMDGLSPGMGRLCDIGFVVDPDTSTRSYGGAFPDLAIGQTVIRLAVEVNPYTNTHIINPGVHRLIVKLAAANSKPVTRTIEINQIGTLFNDD